MAELPGHIEAFKPRYSHGRNVNHRHWQEEPRSSEMSKFPAMGGKAPPRLGELSELTPPTPAEIPGLSELFPMSLGQSKSLQPKVHHLEAK